MLTTIATAAILRQPGRPWIAAGLASTFTLTYDPDKRTLRTDDGSIVAIAVGQAR